MVTTVEDKPEPDAARLRHRLAKRPDPIELAGAPTFDVPTFLRAESSVRKRGKVAGSLVVLDIDPDGRTNAERAREPCIGVRQRNGGVAQVARIPDEGPAFGLNPESTPKWRNMRHLDQQLAQHRPAELAPTPDLGSGGVGTGVFVPRPLRQDALGVNAFLANDQYDGDVS